MCASHQQLQRSAPARPAPPRYLPSARTHAAPCPALPLHSTQLVGRLSEEYLALLPETLPFLAELLEDAELAVEVSRSIVGAPMSGWLSRRVALVRHASTAEGWQPCLCVSWAVGWRAR